MSKHLLMLFTLIFYVLTLSGCKNDKVCSTFIRPDVTITQLTNNPKCFIGKRVTTGGYVKERQLGVFIYENQSDREFDRQGNAIVMYKGTSNNKFLKLFDNADYVNVQILYGGAQSIDDIYDVKVLTQIESNP